MKREFKILSEVQHILERPDMYLGSTLQQTRTMWFLDKETNKFVFQDVEFVPALLKYFDELIDNSLDVAIDTNFKTANVIKINLDNKSIKVSDNGTGIPVEPPKTPDPKKRLCPELAFTQLRAGTSFKAKRKGPSANGVGSVCVNIFSKVFNAISNDGKKEQTIECKNNMSEIVASKPKIKRKNHGVTVYAEPDLERFGLEEITEVYEALLYQRLTVLAIAYPQITFYFNDKKLSANQKNFTSMFHEEALSVSSDNTVVCVFPNDDEDFRFYSYVNSIYMPRGGTQVSYVTDKIISPIKEKLEKKYKNIQTGTIKNKISVVVLLTDFNDPRFDAQTKESLTNTPGEFSTHINDAIDFEAFAKKVLKTPSIIDPIIETFKVKEEVKSKLLLKKTKKVKIAAEKYLGTTGAKTNLFLAEGLSAKSGLSACMGRDGNSFYALRGVPINVITAKVSDIFKNNEFADVLKILDLDIQNKNSTIDYDRVIISSDADADGIHITSILIGWFKKYAPHLFNQGKICKLVTPLLLTRDKKGKMLDYFFSVEEFKNWEKKNTNKNYVVDYIKGLGSWELEDLRAIIEKNGLDFLLREFKLDEKGNAYIEGWLGKDAEIRKEYLREFSFDIDKV